MKLLKLTATFGKLDHETLELHDGLNVLTRPNEAGKSTWAAFLLAMFYGIDTRERASAGVLPMKTKYRPWSGAAMEGVMELEHEGRRITLERTSRGRAPMGEFCAYDTATGQPISGLTAENCGQVLLGAERSVFERSAFLQQNAMAVTSDAALERKLAALVTSGDEDVSCSDTQKRLREAKNRCQHNKTGLLPTARAELADVEDRLRGIEDLHRQDRVLLAQRDQLTQQTDTLRRVVQGFAAQTAQRQQQHCRDAEAAQQRAQDAYAAQQAVTARLPEEAALQSLARALETPQSTPAPLPEAPTPPQDAIFSGWRAEDVQRQAQQAVAEYDRLCHAKKAAHTLPLPALIPALIVLLAAAVFSFIRRLVPVGCGLLLLGFLLIRIYQNGQRAAQDAAAAEKLLQTYAASSRDDILARAADYVQRMALYEQQLAAFQTRTAELAAAEQARREQEAALLGQASMLGAPVTTRADALHAVQQALAQYRLLQTRAAELSAAKQACETAHAMLPEQPQAAFDPSLLAGYTPAQAEQQLRQLERQLADVRSAVDLGRGRAAALGDSAALSARKEQLTARIRELETAYAALELAETALTEANDTLQTRLSPQLCALAGQLLARLTGSRYDAVLLDQKLRAAAREAGGSVAREILCLSSGTADQVYLAVRLAICRLSLGTGTPLVLDDALLRFDDARLARALAVLQEEAASRQILLFTCQSRESTILQTI